MKVLIAYDGSACADAAIDDLRNAGLPREGEALVVTVAHGGWPHSKHSEAELGQFGSPWTELMTNTGEYASKAAARFQSDFPAWKVTSEPLWGEPVETIKKTIEHWSPDLLVVGSHGRSAVGRLLLGSVSLRLVHEAKCSVRVVRAEEPAVTGPLRVLLATDGSTQAEAAVHVVARRTWPADALFRIVSLVPTLVPPVSELVPSLEGHTFASERAYKVIDAADEAARATHHKAAENAAKILEGAGLNVSLDVRDGDSLREIAGEAERWQASVIFVGARGLGAVDRFLMGSVSTAVVTHAHCSVEVIRQV
jgi:nucleotide-binding universal stress UspA family protein